MYYRAFHLGYRQAENWIASTRHFPFFSAPTFEKPPAAKNSCRLGAAPEGPDGGIDIVAHRDELGFEPPLIKVQVKSTEGNVGGPVVQALYGNVESNEFGLLVTLGDFTNQAKSFAKRKSNLRLIGAEELVELILAHYEQFDPTYKGVLALRKVYVPQPITEEE